jgi:thioredoxin reductase (NADPH)
MSQLIDVAIIGAGPVGLFAAFQAGMLNMTTCVIDILDKVGGQCSELYPEKPIYDIPGYPKILGKDLVKNLKEQADTFAPTYYLNQEVEILHKESETIWQITTKQGLTIKAKVVLIAAGNGSIVPNKPHLTCLEEFEKNGTVVYKVDDIEKFRDKKIGIIGGGDSAFDWANLIAPISKKLYLIHRRESFRCASSSLNSAQVHQNEGRLEFVTPYTLHDLKGEDGVLKQIELRHVKEGTEKLLGIDLLLMLVGLKTSFAHFIQNFEIEKGHIKVDASTMQSNLNGIYAIGDVSTYSNKLKLILTGFSEAALALHSAHERIFGVPKLHFEYSTSRTDIPR